MVSREERRLKRSIIANGVVICREIFLPSLEATQDGGTDSFKTPPLGYEICRGNSLASSLVVINNIQKTTPKKSCQ